ncbi:MAG TPA: radical SAM protein [Candidatus Deferrimicrobiaceae bacterium]|jgi:radical SAM superfamily enzyme YgiQ (UPF0313 family)
MGIDILFIHPGNHAKTYQALAAEFTAVAPPAWTLMLACGLRDRGIETAIHDVNVEGWDADILRDLLEKHRPRLVSILVYGHNPSASTQTMPAARRIVLDLKAAEPDLPVALGGTHPSALPQKTLAEESADFVIQGEGLHTLEDLVGHLRGKRDLGAVRGLWYRKDGIATPGAPIVQIADPDSELRSCDWGMLPPLTAYRAHNMHCFDDFQRSETPDFSDVRSPYAVIHTSLGCPYDCDYCCIHAVFGKPGIRYWSLDNVLGRIDDLVMRHHVRNIRIEDELFILSGKRVEGFCDRLIERNYDLNLWAYGRVDTIDPALLDKMARAGIRWICLGIESGNEAVRRGVRKKISGDIREVVRLIRNSGIRVLGNYMFGLPDDTIGSMQETLALARELNTEFANFYSVMAYPGSRLYEQAAAVPGVVPDAWEGFSQHGYHTAPLPTKTLSPAQVLKFRDEAFLAYHSDPAYLAMIRSAFGDAVVRHLEKMLSLPVKRRLLEES